MALPNYVKTVWKNLTAPAINATNLNKIENGIYDATAQAIQNSGGISTNTQDIATLVSTDNSKTYDHVSTTAIAITATTYEDIVTLTTQSRDAGIYQVTISFTFDYDSTNKSAHFQWSFDGGTNWEEYRIEPKDKTDKKTMTYTFPLDKATAGIFDIRVQGKCEASSNHLNVDYANIIIERKK